MTASIIDWICLQLVKYERLHSFLWGVFHNWTKLWSFINLWRMSSIFGGRQQIWQQNINVCKIWETFSGCSQCRVPINSIRTKTLQNSFVWEIFIGWWYINHVMWSATDSCLQLNQNGSLCFVKKGQKWLRRGRRSREFRNRVPVSQKPNCTRVPVILTLVTAGRPVIDRSA